MFWYYTRADCCRENIRTHRYLFPNRKPKRSTHVTINPSATPKCFQQLVRLRVGSKWLPGGFFGFTDVRKVRAGVCKVKVCVESFGSPDLLGRGCLNSCHDC